MAADNPDFARLYVRLGLPPDCTLAQFKHACRLRIAQLHPDRSSPGVAPTPDLPVSELISLYVSAIRFHRRHGRLPGALPVAPARVAAPTPHASAAAQATATGRDEAAASPSWRNWLLAAMATAVLLALLAMVDREPAPAMHAGPASDETAAVDGPVAGRAAIPSQLELGMDRAAVLEIQGEPLQQDERDWLYGPSWIRFEKGRVVDWYSSPLYRLRTATASPPQDAAVARDPP